MKFSENWLRTYVNPLCTSDELAHALTMAGIEVENVESVAPDFEEIVVAEVVAIERHPEADRLKICSVNIGVKGDDPLQIVCGASNVDVGVKIPCALIGATLPGLRIKKTKLRGVESSGMLCSAKELGINEANEGLLLLPEDAPVGMSFRDYYELNDKLFTLNLTPNRADCLGLSGIAREVSAITETELVSLEITPVHHTIDDAMDVHVTLPEACPLYCGRIIREINLDVSTPLWLKQRLERSGIRSINPIVDITNYVLLETGQPMHAFDLAKLNGSIQIRYAQSTERLQLLNGNQIELTTDMLIVADAYKPLALAGIMGGMDSGVTQGATDIFLECAFFSPSVISGKSFRLGFNTDSAYRFERGVDFAMTRSALERATSLIVTICGGKVGPITEKKYELPQRVPVIVRADRVKQVLGIDINHQQIMNIFNRLGFIFSVEANVFSVTPPTYRFDLAIEEDFIEELARIYGYDCIPTSFPYANMAMLAASETSQFLYALKGVLTVRDYQEVINYSFVDATWEKDFSDNNDLIYLKNPIASQMSVMRSTLIGGLISNLQFNLNRKQARVRLFEIGACFVRNQDSDYKQIEKLAGLCYGDAVTEQWSIPARVIDFYDMKSDIDALFRGKEVLDFRIFNHPALHPGKSASIHMENVQVGWLGELHPRWQKKYNLPRSVVLFELDLNVFMTDSQPTIKEISKFPPVRRDIAIVVDNTITVQSLLDCMYEKKLPLISDIALFDIYRGKEMDKTKKSLAFRVLLQDTQKTLTDEEADFVMKNLMGALENKFGAVLRN